ncbi:MAG: type VI secretion system protein TssA [Geminicoccaceae bacterium]
MRTMPNRESWLTFEHLPVDPRALLDPVAGDEGASGAFLLHDPIYDAIRVARRADNPLLPQGIWETDLKRADWDHVIATATDALCLKSKDLQLAAWLTEGALHRHGLAGLAEGLIVSRTIAEAFWPDIHPRLDADDPTARLAPLEWINAKLPPVIRRLPLTQPTAADDRRFCLEQWDEAARDGTAGGDAPSRGRILSAIEASEPDWCRKLEMASHRAITEIDALSGLLDHHCGSNAPSLAALRQIMVEVAAFLAHNKGVPTMAQAAAVEQADPAARKKRPIAQAITGRELNLGSNIVRGRDEAYAMLGSLAAYLIELEPHSPAPYLVRRAVSWGEMPLPQLLDELRREYGDVDRVIATLGLTEVDTRSD